MFDTANKVFKAFNTYKSHLVLFHIHMRDQALFHSCLSFITVVISNKPIELG